MALFIHNFQKHPSFNTQDLSSFKMRCWQKNVLSLLYSFVLVYLSPTATISVPLPVQIQPVLKDYLSLLPLQRPLQPPRPPSFMLLLPVISIDQTSFVSLLFLVYVHLPFPWLGHSFIHPSNTSWIPNTSWMQTWFFVERTERWANHTQIWSSWGGRWGWIFLLIK